jgi:hypothetical protein
MFISVISRCGSTTNLPQRCVDPGNLVLWQRAESTSELARLAYVLLGPRLTTVYIALVLAYSNGGLLALGGTDHVLIEYTTNYPPETTCNARWHLYPNLRYTKK